MTSPIRLFVRSTFAASMAATALLAACTKAPAPVVDAPPASAAAPAAGSSLSLPVSLNGIMVGAVDHASDPLFDVGNGKLPKNDDAWREVEYHAYQMVAAGKVIQIPGTGPKDAEWTANPEWKRQAEELSKVGLDMLKLAQAKDAKGFEDAGNRLVAVCEGCHTQFKPDIPTMKILHKPDFPHGEK